MMWNLALIKKLIIAFIILLCLVAAVSYALFDQYRDAFYYKNLDVSNPNVSDVHYLDVAKQTPEAKLFLNIYPEASVLVVRQERLRVEFTVIERNPTLRPDEGFGDTISLYVPIDAVTTKVDTETMHLRLYLRHDGQERRSDTIVKQPKILTALGEAPVIDYRKPYAPTRADTK